MKKPEYPAVIYVRHGTTDMNVGKKEFRGWDDPPLNAEGLKDAELAAEVVAQFKIFHIYAGSLKRTMQTAMAIAEKTGARITPTSSLIPWNYGEFTGKEITDESLKKLKEFQDHPTKVVPGGESYSAFIMRYEHAVNATRRFAVQNPDKILVNVTHSRNLYPLQRMLGDKTADIPVHETDGSRQGMPATEKPGSAWLVEFLPNDKFRITGLDGKKKR